VLGRLLWPKDRTLLNPQPSRKGKEGEKRLLNPRGPPEDLLDLLQEVLWGTS